MYGAIAVYNINDYAYLKISVKFYILHMFIYFLFNFILACPDKINIIRYIVRRSIVDKHGGWQFGSVGFILLIGK